MKKTVLAGVLLVSGLVFAHEGFGGRNSDNPQQGYRMMGGPAYSQSLTEEQQKKLLDERNQMMELRNKYSLKLSEKRLDLQKEMIKEQVEWKKVEKINGEIANIQADMRTDMYKHHVEIGKITGDKFVPHMGHRGNRYCR